MDDPKIAAAVIAGVVSIVTAVISSIITFRVSEKKHEREYKLDYSVEEIVLKFLNHPKWRFRTFKTIKYHIAGFEDNELRQILLRVGAIRFEDGEGAEIWGLFERIQP
jgi:hypothetical protein